MNDIKITHPRQLEEFFTLANQFANPELWAEYQHFINTILHIEGTYGHEKGLYFHNDSEVAYLYDNEGLIFNDIIFKKQITFEQSKYERARIAREHKKTAVIFDKGTDKDINKKWLSEFYNKDKSMSISIIPGVNYTYSSEMLDYNTYYGTSSHLDKDVRKAIRLVYETDIQKEQITDTKYELKLGDFTISMCHISELTHKQIQEQVELAKVWKSTKVSNGYLGIIGSSAFIIERLSNNKWKFNYKDFSKQIPLYIIDLRYKGILLTTHQFTKLNDDVYTLPGYKPIMFDKSSILINPVPTKIIRAVSNLKYYTVIRVIKETLQSHTDKPFILNDMSGSYALTKDSIYNNTYLENMSWRKNLDEFKTKHKPCKILKQWKAHPKEAYNLLIENAGEIVLKKKASIF